MSTELIVILSGAVGAALSGLFSWLTSKTKTSGDERTAFRKSILNRVNELEEKQNNLENVVMVWKGRYWSLYTWLVNFCIANGIAATPPSFHEMGFENLKNRFKNGGDKNEPAEETE